MEICNLQSAIRNRAWRWDWILLGVGASIFWGATTTPSAYFLHFDAGTQDVMALSLNQGCWEYATEKYFAILLLAVVFKILGASVLWETLILIAASAVTVVGVYELTRAMTDSKWAGLLSALLLIALPAFQYFSRTHLGYVTTLLVLAWLAVWYERWGWAGLLFSFAFAAHFNAAVAVGLSLGMLALFYLRPSNWKKWAHLVIALILPIVFIDFLFFLHNGQMFYWSLGTVGVSMRWSGVSAGAAPALQLFNLLWLPQTVWGSNGVLLSILLALSLIAPLLLWKNHKAFAMSVAFLGTAAFYTAVAATRDGFVSRALAPSYPFWAIGAGVVLGWLVERLPKFKQIALSGVVIVLSLSIISTGFFIREFTQTLHPQVEAWVLRAAKEGRPIRHVGNPWLVLFFAQANQVEIVSGDNIWIEDNKPGQAILIFEGSAPAHLNRDGYVIDSVEMDRKADEVYTVLTREAMLASRYEVWMPTRSSEPIPSIDPSRPQKSLTYHYSATRCVTPPPFGNGTLYYYQLAWKRLTERIGIR
ncbi:MAG: hypothetical protein AAB261_00585 [Chloroflexota bacterium]